LETCDRVPAIIQAAVEGISDEVVVRRLIAHVGAEPGTVYGKRGKPHLRIRIAGYNNAARHAPWLVVVDLDNEMVCAPALRSAWVPSPAARLCFRVAVRAVEAWLMADADTLASFLRVAPARIPADPDAHPVPKRLMIDLARASRSRAIKEDMVPRPGSGRAVGPAYTSRIIEYASSHWRPDEAARRSDSLRRAIACLKRWVPAE
jgi:hypothetical protein